MNPPESTACRLYSWLMSTVINIFNCCNQHQRKKKRGLPFVLRFKTGLQSFIQGRDLKMRLTFEEQCEATVVPVTPKGNPAKIDGDVAWTSSDEAVATVTSTGPTSGLVVAVGVGVCQIAASFDADLDVGETREVLLTGAIEVVEAEAAAGEIVFGPAVTQP